MTHVRSTIVMANRVVSCRDKVTSYFELKKKTLDLFGNRAHLK